MVAQNYKGYIFKCTAVIGTSDFCMQSIHKHCFVMYVATQQSFCSYVPVIHLQYVHFS